MPIFIAPPINYQPIIQTSMTHQVMIDDVKMLEKKIIAGVLGSKQGYVLLEVGTYTLHDVKTHYDVPTDSIGQIMLDVGRLGIATKLVMSEIILGVDSGKIYLLATNNTTKQVPLNTQVKTF
jgi:hypothetical protein